MGQALQHKPARRRHIFHLRVPEFKSPLYLGFSSLLIACGEEAGDGSGSSIPTPHEREQDGALGFWLQFGPALDDAGIYGVNHQMEAVSLSLWLCLSVCCSAFQIHKNKIDYIYCLHVYKQTIHDKTNHKQASWLNRYI